MDLGVLGTGRMGRALAEAWARAGHRVVLGSRTPEAVGALPPGLSGAGYAQAAAQPVVVLATPYAATAGVVAAHAAALAGRIIVDITNPFGAAPPGQSGIEVHRAVLGRPAHWAAAFKTNFALTIGGGGSPPPQCLIAADGPQARAAAAELARAAGFAPLDCGGLEHAATLDGMVPLLLALDRSLVGGARSAWRLEPGQTVVP